jgi:hypothetical protein
MQVILLSAYQISPAFLQWLFALISPITKENFARPAWCSQIACFKSITTFQGLNCTKRRKRSTRIAAKSVTFIPFFEVCLLANKFKWGLEAGEYQYHVPLHISRKEVCGSILECRASLCRGYSHLLFFLSLRHVDDGCERSTGVNFQDYDSVFSSTTSEGLKKIRSFHLVIDGGILK